MGVVALSLSAIACNTNEKAQKSESGIAICKCGECEDCLQRAQINAEIAEVKKMAAEMSYEELAEVANKRSYALGASMGLATNFQFSDFELDPEALKQSIINFYITGDVESAEFEENNMKFQEFIYTRFYPHMQAKQTRDAMEAGGVTEGLPEVPALYDEDFSKQTITNILGAQMGASLIDVDGIHMGWVMKAFDDCLTIATEDPAAFDAAIEETLLIGIEELQTEYMSVQQEMMEKNRIKAEQKAQEAKDGSAAWLAEVEQMDGVQKTESGLLYRIDREGSAVHATADSDMVEVNYEGKTRDGNIFDSSYERGESITFGLNQVIRGWTEGMKLIGEGGQITLWIPSELAYGERGAGRDIGPNEALEFKVELIKVNPTAVVE